MKFHEYKVENRRDPFLTLIVEEKKAEPKVIAPKTEETTEPIIVTQSEYRLIGLAWDNRESLAIIKKGEKTWLVKEGRSLDSFRVALIDGKKGEVTLWGENKIIQLKLAEREK